MKKIITVFLSMAMSLCVLFGTIVVASAEEITLEEMRNVLREKYVPQQHLDSLTDEATEQMYWEWKDKVTGYGGTVVSALTETDENDVMPMGVISDEDMLLTMTNVFVYSNANTMQIGEIQIFIQYYWKKKPRNVKTDAIAVNWDAGVFTYKSNSFSSTDVARALRGNEGVYNHTTTNYPAVLTQGGLGYDVLLKSRVEADGKGYTTKELSGSATFCLYPKENPMYNRGNAAAASYTTAINMQYRHNRNPFAGSVGFTVVGFTVGFDLSAFTDTATTRSLNVFYSY